MKADLFPDEMDLPCGSTEQAAERKRMPRKPVPLVAAHSSISMRYDPSRPGGVTVIDPRDVISLRDCPRRKDLRRRDEIISEEREGPEKHTAQSQDLILPDEARSPTRKSKDTSRRRPLPLAPARSSVSTRLAPSRPDRVLVINPASPRYIDENDAISPLSDHVSTTSSAPPYEGYPVELDDESLKQKNHEDALSKRKGTTRSLRRPLPLAYQRSSVSVQTAPSVIERASVRKLNDKYVPSHRTNRRKGYTIELEDESNKHHARNGDEWRQYSSQERIRSHSNTAQYSNTNGRVSASAVYNESVNDCSAEDDGPLACSSPYPISPRERHFPPADQTKASMIRAETAENCDDGSDHQLYSPCEESSLRNVRTMHSDFEVEVRVHEETDKRDEACLDDDSRMTPDIVPSESMCSSVNTTTSNGTKTKGLLRRMVPTKIKDKITQINSGARSVFSAPERKLPQISEMMACDNDPYDTKRSAGATVTIHPNVLEHVTSELTDANFSEDQSIASTTNDYVAKRMPEKRKGSTKTHRGNTMQTTRREKEMIMSRNLSENDANNTDDQKSMNSSNSYLKKYRAVAHMLSPVTSDLSVTISESFESRRVRKSVPENNSVASKASLFSRSNQSSGGQRRSNMNSANIVSRQLSADLSAEKEDTITTIYDRNARAPYSFLTRSRVEENTNSDVLEDQPDSALQENQQKGKRSDTSFTGYAPSSRLFTLRPAKAQFGLSFGADDESSLSGMNRHRSERSRKAELAMLPSEDSGILEDSLPDPSPEYLKPELDDSALNPFLVSLNSFRAQFGL